MDFFLYVSEGADASSRESNFIQITLPEVLKNNVE
jgi:hypothetical protein